MIVNIKKLHEDAKIPKYAKFGDAGLDLTAISKEFTDSEDTYITYGTGLSIEIPQGFVGLIFPRSSLCNYDLALTNHIGVIDSGYRGEIKFKYRLTNPFPYDTTTTYDIGDKIGQLVIIPYPQIQLVEVEDLSESERGNGGFGSSGK